jgi:hypothetical protein
MVPNKGTGLLSGELSMRRMILLWVLFFLICFGLGYPILNRYDPGKLPGTSDAADYRSAVTRPLTLSYRILVPALAKPFYFLAEGRLKTWDPAYFGLLVVSSILSAGTAIAIIAIGLRCNLPFTTSLVGAMLFLFDFAVPNWNLSGYVDSGEAFFLAMVVWSLLSDRWYLLAIWAIPGSLAKDTFAPFAVLFSLIWWIRDWPIRPLRAIWIGALAILSGLAVLASLRSSPGLASGGAQYTISMRQYGEGGFLAATLRGLTVHEFWLTFAWLLPLGLVRIWRLDRRWIWATAGTFLLALIFGGYNNALGNTSRALFNISGPLLSLAAADLLTRPGSASEV